MSLMTLTWWLLHHPGKEHLTKPSTTHPFPRSVLCLHNNHVYTLPGVSKRIQASFQTERKQETPYCPHSIVGTPLTAASPQNLAH